MSTDSPLRRILAHKIAPMRLGRGFTLTELLVGVAIGLIGIIAMFHVLSTWDKTKRTTAAGSDAQIAGAVGFFRLERDVKQGGMGFGMAKSPVMGCNVSTVVNATATTTARAAFTFPLVPVRITQGASGAPDSLQVFYGNSSFFTADQPFKDSTTTSKKAESRNGFKVGDVVVVSDGASNCALIEVSSDTNPDLLTLEHNGLLRFKPGPGAAFSSGLLFNMGKEPQLNIWQVANGTLVLTDGLYRNTTISVADGVIDLQAQYGIDSNGDYKVDTWQDADPADWTRLLAVRVSILTRSQQYEPSSAGPVYVTATAPVLSWLDSSNAAIPFTMKNVDGTDDDNPGNDNDWRNYRYRVYGGVISLRNMVWGISP